MSRIEPALFLLADGSDLLGVVITHVDDLLSTGYGEAYENTIKVMESELHLTIKKENFRFCGKNIVQKDGEIMIDQMDAIEGVDYLILPTERRKAPNSPLSDMEKTAFRGLIGQLGWIARQSRPDIMVGVSLAAQSMGSPCVKDIVALNKSVKLLKSSSDVKLRFRKSDLTLENAVVYVFADSSFGNVDGVKSQCGFLVGLTSESICDGGPTELMVLETYSGSIKRVCRSTLAAKANGFLAGAEAAAYLRMTLMELVHPDIPLRDLDQHYLKKKIIAFTDARSLEQTLNKDTGMPSDKRVRVLVAQIKEMLGENDYSDDSDVFARWVDTSRMLADVLTKEGCDRQPLIHALTEGVWQLEPSAQAKEKKLLIRAGRHSRKAALVKAEDG